MNLNPRDAVIVDFARTPMGRSKNGCFRHTRADDLSAALVDGLFARNPELDPADAGPGSTSRRDDVTPKNLSIAHWLASRVYATLDEHGLEEGLRRLAQQSISRNKP